VEFNHITAGILWMDDALSAVLARVQALGKADDTIVIFSTEHGPSVGGKFSLYETGTRIPFVMQWTNGIPGGQVIDRFVQNIDFLPTLLEAAGVEIPDGMVVDGRSFLPLVRGGEAKAWRQDLYFEFGYARAIRTETWKYIAWRPPVSLTASLKDAQAECLYTIFGRRIATGRPRPDLLTPTLMRYPHYFDMDQLYDLEKDPEETHNLVAEDAYAGVLSDMRRRLRAYLDTFDDTFDLEQVDAFYQSPRYRRLQAIVFADVERLRPLWEAEARANGFYATAFPGAGAE